MVLPGQAELFAAEDFEGSPPPPPEAETITCARQKPKRQTLPKDLPRERIELDVADSEKVSAKESALLRRRPLDLPG